MPHDNENQIHIQLWAAIAALKAQIRSLKDQVHEMQHRSTITITHCIFIGGHMLDLTRLNAALAKNKNLGDVFDTFFNEIVSRLRDAGTDQAKLDELVTTLESDNVREELKTNALKDLVVPGGGGGTGGPLSASFAPTSATVGESYQGQVTVAGGSGPYTISINYAGALPGGLSFNPDGTVSGIPDTAGAFSFDGSVSDSAGATVNWAGGISVS